MLAAAVVGTIPSWIFVATTVFVAWRLSRGGAGAAVSELSTANKVLEDALKADREKFGAEIRDLRIENAELRGRTDVAIAMRPVIEWTSRHETRAAERHEATIVVLDLIAKRLGPEPNGDS